MQPPHEPLTVMQHVRDGQARDKEQAARPQQQQEVKDGGGWGRESDKSHAKAQLGLEREWKLPRLPVAVTGS
jgi:hypothetical protein